MTGSATTGLGAALAGCPELSGVSFWPIALDACDRAGWPPGPFFYIILTDLVGFVPRRVLESDLGAGDPAREPYRSSSIVM